MSPAVSQRYSNHSGPSPACVLVSGISSEKKNVGASEYSELTLYSMQKSVCFYTCVSVGVQMDIQWGAGHTKTAVYCQVIKKQPYYRTYAMASDNQWAMFSIALYRRIDIYIYIYSFVLYIICRFIKKGLILITSSGDFFYIHYCNELLSKMIYKRRVFCYAGIYNSFKKQAFVYFPQSRWKRRRISNDPPTTVA